MSAQIIDFHDEAAIRGRDTLRFRVGDRVSIEPLRAGDPRLEGTIISRAVDLRRYLVQIDSRSMALMGKPGMFGTFTVVERRLSRSTGERRSPGGPAA